MTVIYLMQGAVWGLWATSSPGPFQAFLLAQTLRNGWRRTLPAALAPLFSDGPIIAVIFLLLSQIPPAFLNIIRLAGGLFILYLAYGAFITMKQPKPLAPTPIEQPPTQRSFLKAVLMNALSPGPYIFWSVLVGPIVLEAWRKSPGLGLSFVFGFYLALIGGFVAFIILFATARQFGPRVNRTLQAVSAVALLGFGLYQLAAGMTALI